MVRFWSRRADPDAPATPPAEVAVSALMPRWRLGACALLMLANAALAGLLLLQHHRVGTAVSAVSQARRFQSEPETRAQTFRMARL